MPGPFHLSHVTPILYAIYVSVGANCSKTYANTRIVLRLCTMVGYMQSSSGVNLTSACPKSRYNTQQLGNLTEPDPARRGQRERRRYCSSDRDNGRPSSLIQRLSLCAPRPPPHSSRTLPAQTWRHHHRLPDTGQQSARYLQARPDEPRSRGPQECFHTLGLDRWRLQKQRSTWRPRRMGRVVRGPFTPEHIWAPSPSYGPNKHPS